MSPRRFMNGVVISDKMDKTVVVSVKRIVKHPRYKKYIRKRSKFKAHDERNECRVGDEVLIMESRPLSKEKRWVVKGIIRKGTQYI
jgi:small subunit ribosomal protein S17